MGATVPGRQRRPLLRAAAPLADVRGRPDEVPGAGGHWQAGGGPRGEEGAAQGCLPQLPAQPGAILIKTLIIMCMHTYMS